MIFSENYHPNNTSRHKKREDIRLLLFYILLASIKTYLAFYFNHQHTFRYIARMQR
jgi:hypothetical protein